MISKTAAKPIVGVTAVEIDMYGKIKRVETADSVNFHDVLRVIKAFNSGQWVHPEDAAPTDPASMINGKS